MNDFGTYATLNRIEDAYRESSRMPNKSYTDKEQELLAMFLEVSSNWLIENVCGYINVKCRGCSDPMSTSMDADFITDFKKGVLFEVQRRNAWE